MSQTHSTTTSSPFTFINKAIGLVLSLGFGGACLTMAYTAIQTMSSSKPAAAPTAAAPSASPSAPTPPPASTPPAAGGADTASIARGKTVYMAVCFACHQPTGLGFPNMFPPLVGSDWVAAKKPDRMIRMVLHGVTGPIHVNGKPFTTPAPMMPPQGAALNDTQIADVLTYVRSEYGNKSSAVTPDMVKAIRESEKARVAMWSEAELLKIPVE